MPNPNKIRRFLAIFIVLGVFSLAVPIGVKIYRSKGLSSIPRGRVPTADISLKKIHLSETKEGKKRWDLVADRADYDKDSERTRLLVVKVTVASDRSEGDITVVADRADYHNATGDLWLKGNVRASTQSGMAFVTASANYVASRSVIHTNAPVLFSSPMMTVEGRGMELAVNDRSVKILDGVTASITPPDGKK